MRIIYFMLISLLLYSSAALSESVSFPRAYFYKYKHSDDVFYVIPPDPFQNEQNWEKYTDLSDAHWGEWDAIIIPAEKVRGIPFETMYVEGDLKIENIKVDPNFEHKVKPPWKIKIDHGKKLTQKIKEEREKESPDIVKILTLKDELESLQGWSEKRCYEQELKNMDEDEGGSTLKRRRLLKAIEQESKH